jgi:hypothetical protein
MLPSLEFITTYPFVYDYTNDRTRIDYQDANLILYHEEKGKNIDLFGHTASLVDSTYKSVLIEQDGAITFWLLYIQHAQYVECVSLFSSIPTLSVTLFVEALKIQPIKVYITKQSITHITAVCKIGNVLWNRRKARLLLRQKSCNHPNLIITNSHSNV